MPKLRVYYSTPQSIGYSKDEIKLFSDKSAARKYALKLVKTLKLAAKETDDDESVIIEDLKLGNVIEAWRNEMGKVEHYPRGW